MTRRFSGFPGKGAPQGEASRSGVTKKPWASAAHPYFNASAGPSSTQNQSHRMNHPSPIQQSGASAPPGWQPVNRPPKKKAPVKILVLASLLVLLLGGSIWAVKTLRDNQVRQSIAPYQKVFGPNIYVNEVALSGLTPEQAFNSLRQEMASRINSWNLSLTFRGHTFITLNYGALGIQVKEEELYQLLSEAWKLTHTGDIYARKAAIDALTISPHSVSTAHGELQSTQLQIIIKQIADAINTEPVDAALLEFRPDDVQPFVFLDEKVGLRLDVDAAMQQVMTLAVQGQSGSYELEPQVIPPLVTRAELEKTVRLRTSITTGIDKDSTDERNHNIRLSFSKFNGMVLKPGQTFSFNEVVGPRTLENGFAEALEYAYGDLVIGVGGGVCQASTTLYQAAVTAGLSVIKRYPHSGPVDYTQLGQDATVFLTRDRNIDFVFKNTTAGNIYITARVQPTRNNARRLEAVISMYGLDLGDGVSYKLRSEVVQVLEPPQEKVYEADKDGKYVTYTDQEKLKSKAVKGQVIETYLEKYQNGVLIGQPKLVSSDTFRAKAAVYYRGVTKRP